MKERLLSLAIYGLSTALGVTAFLYPLFLPAPHLPSGTLMIEGAGSTIQESAIPGQAHAADAPLVLTLLVGICFVAVLLEVQARTGGAKLVALVGILVSINAVLRFVEVAIPGPGGFSLIFFLITLSGYVFGGGLGFLVGSLTLFVSALITGGVGPWLPYQMFAAGWMGLSAPLCRPLAGGGGRWREVVVLAAFAGLWALVYGAIMNMWFWPYAIGPAEQHWQPGLGPAEVLQRYLLFYAVTSLGWDLLGAAGNILLMLAFGPAALRALRRFHRRFAFSYQPEVGVSP